jgi:hypothetical protein
MDIDKQIQALEGRTLPVTLGSKTIFMKIGICLIISIIILYLVRPYYLLRIESDTVDKKCVAKINMKYFTVTSIVFTGVIFYTLQKYNVFTD